MDITPENLIKHAGGIKEPSAAERAAETDNPPHGEPGHVCRPYPSALVELEPLPNQTGFKVHVHGLDMTPEQAVETIQAAAAVLSHGMVKAADVIFMLGMVSGDGDEPE